MIRQKLLFPGERSIKEKYHTVEKLAEPAEKQKVLEDCYQRIKEAASDNNTSQRCRICHYQNHTVPGQPDSACCQRISPEEEEEQL